MGRGRQLLGGDGRVQGGLQVDRLVEQLVANQHNQREEAQLEVTVWKRHGGEESE